MMSFLYSICIFLIIFLSKNGSGEKRKDLKSRNEKAILKKYLREVSAG
jgi:hypothetical protein